VAGVADDPEHLAGVVLDEEALVGFGPGAIQNDIDGSIELEVEVPGKASVGLLEPRGDFAGALEEVVSGIVDVEDSGAEDAPVNGAADVLLLGVGRGVGKGDEEGGDGEEPEAQRFPWAWRNQRVR